MLPYKSPKKKKVQYNLKRRLIKATVYTFMSDSGHKGPKYLVYQTINGTTKPTKLYNYSRLLLIIITSFPRIFLCYKS